jgi:FG-GAP repeat
MPLHHVAPRPAGTLTVLVVGLCTVAWAQFETRSSSPIIYSPQAVAVGDFNHDGKLDVATITLVYSGQAAVLLGNGNGTFQPPVYYAIDSNLRRGPKEICKTKPKSYLVSISSQIATHKRTNFQALEGRRESEAGHLRRRNGSRVGILEGD